MTPGLWVLVASVVLACAFGLWRAMTDGRFRGTHRVRGAGREAATSDPAGTAHELPHADSAVKDTAYADQLGERATLLQFSSAFCAPCRVTRRTLEEVAAVVPGVVHLEVDAESHLDLVRRLDVMRTPTTLVLDASGVEVTRAAGAPTKQQVLTALAQVD
ncbi:thioredoxin family protein [Nocardioides jishulii]|uniref:Thioredoxin family protein n=1 Tax=Nocardioides jishulii TaxID=2575440 RepID=A0A4U2YQQ2_9ACTN|nr:thioredoxin family protein [Nocardioides jishulii]QCX26457.1 thioredoxin family protein [Nocardioides jishulii]TKI63737.1 thioredoxin family protein [Nocardioides jishulii]